MTDVNNVAATAERVVDAVLRDLRGRKGFDWWWDDIDDEIQAEIRTSLVAKVEEVLPR